MALCTLNIGGPNILKDKWLESYRHSNIICNDVRPLKQELADLLEEDAKTDKLRSLHFYSCRITGFRFVCSKCYDKVYLYASTKTLNGSIRSI
jgi:hypothetical protein